MKSRNKRIISTTATFGVLAAATLWAQDSQQKYSLVSPGGIAFADFKGYEDWAVVSSARADEVLKVIVGNPAIIDAFKEKAYFDHVDLIRQLPFEKIVGGHVTRWGTHEDVELQWAFLDDLKSTADGAGDHEAR